MQVKAKLLLAHALSVGLLISAGYGNLEPTYQLDNGATTNSWAVAKASPHRVVDKSPNLGWLKIVACVGSLGTAVGAMILAELAEHEHEAQAGTRAVLQELALEQHKLAGQAELTAMVPVAEAVANSKAQRELARAAVSGQAAALPEAEIISQPEAPKEHLQDFPRLFGENPKTALVIGVPGAGKGMFVSNAIRALKSKKPDTWVLGIDPKNDPKESGYWSEGFDQVLRFNQESLNGEELLTYIERIVEQFKAKSGPRLLVFDEFKICCKRMKNADNKRFKEVIDYFVFLASSGDSQEIFFWGIGQSANAEDYGINGGDRGVFKPIAIVSETDKAASKQLLGTKYAPTDSPESVMMMMKESPVGRALYWYPDGQWYPMPELHNYSGYNRDKRRAL